MCNRIRVGWVLSKTVSATLSQRRGLSTARSPRQSLPQHGTVTAGIGAEDQRTRGHTWALGSHTGPTSHTVLTTEAHVEAAYSEAAAMINRPFVYKNFGKYLRHLSPGHPRSPVFIKPAYKYPHLSKTCRKQMRIWQ